MAFYRNPNDDELAKWEAGLAEPKMEPYRDYPPWGLYTYKGGAGLRMIILEYFPEGFSFKCGSCEEDHAIPGPAVGVIADKRFNLLPKDAENDRGVAPLDLLVPCDLPPPDEPVGLTPTRWAH